MLALGVAVVSAVAVGVLRGGDDPDRLAPRAAAPIDLPDVREGRPRVSLADLRGRPVVVNFFASWCGPCRRELPLLVEARARLGDRVAFVGVDFQDNREEAVGFMRELGVDFPAAYDPEGSLKQPYGIVGLPLTVAISPDGTVVDRLPRELSRDRLEALLERVQSSGAVRSS